MTINNIDLSFLGDRNSRRILVQDNLGLDEAFNTVTIPTLTQGYRPGRDDAARGRLRGHVHTRARAGHPGASVGVALAVGSPLRDPVGGEQAGRCACCLPTVSRRLARCQCHHNGLDRAEADLVSRR